MALFGPSKDIKGKCNARLIIGDDHGDNHATMKCQLPERHDGLHEEKYASIESGKVVVTWEMEPFSDRR